MTAAPHPPRYEPKRYVDAVDAGRAWGVWDTFAQSFVVGEMLPTYAASISATARLNRAYREAMT